MSKTMWKPYTFSQNTSDVYIADDTCYINTEQMHYLLNVDEDKIAEILDSGFDSKKLKSLHSIVVQSVPYYDLNSLRYVSEKLNRYESYSRFNDWVYKQNNNGDSIFISMFWVEVVLAIPLISLLNFFIDSNINMFSSFAVLYAFFSPVFLILLNSSFLFFVATSLIAGVGYALCAGYYSTVAFLISFGFLVWACFAERPYGLYFKKPIQYGYNAFRAQIWNGLKKLE